MDTVYTALVFPLLLLIGQTLVALGQRRISQQMDDGQAKTDAKRAKEAEWRQSVDARLDAQDDKIAAVLKGQTTQMRSDLIHRAHRYVDDLGCASVEEKEAFWAEYEDYVQICDANNVVNHYIDSLAERVMKLPERSV